MARPKKSRGFTLIELLVVITIIGMLVSLLLPAIQSAREAGRRNTCSNNMRQATLGLIQVSESKRGFPGYVTAIPTGVATPNYIRASWVVSLLPSLERNDLYDNWQKPNQVMLMQSNPTAYYSPLSILVCPSNANPELGTNPLSYVVNTGIANSADDTTTSDNSNTPVPSGAKLINEDVNAGVFFNHSKWDGTLVANGTVTPAGSAGGKKASVDFISSNDGTSYTILMSENLQANGWAIDPRTNLPYTTDMAVRENTCMVWFLTGNVNNTTPPDATHATLYDPLAMGINDKADFVVGDIELLYDAMLTTQPSGLAFSRPSANHSGGVIVYFCDNHMRYLSNELDYKVYTQLMTPNQKKVNVTPLSSATLASAPSPGWNNPPPFLPSFYILNEADY